MKIFLNGFLLRKKRTIIFQSPVKNLCQGLHPSKHLVVFRKLVVLVILLPSFLQSIYTYLRNPGLVTQDILSGSRYSSDFLGSIMQGHAEGCTGPDLVQHPSLDSHEQQMLPLLYLPAASLQLLRGSLIQSQLVGVQ